MATVELNTIEKKLERLIETKNDIKTAIANKGVTIEDTDTFNSYAEKIDSITTEPNLQAKEVSLTSSAAATYTPDTGYDGLSSVKVTPVTETRTHNVTANGTTTVSVNSGKVGMTKVTVNTNVSPTLTPSSRVQYCQEYGSGAYTIARTCVIPAKSNMLYVVTCICAASGAGAPTITWDSRTGCTYTYVSAASTASQINGVVGMKFYTAYYRVSNTSGAQQTTYIRTTMTENRGIIVSNIYS